MQETKNYKKKILFNSGWQIISRLVFAIVGILSAMILTRFLGPSGYGEFNSIIVYTSIFAVIADLGVYQILLREISQKESDRQKILGNVFVWRMLSSFISFFLAAVLGFLLPYRELIKYIIIIESVRSFVYAIRAFYVTDFQHKLRMDIASIGDIINRVAFIIFIYIASKTNLGLLPIFLFIFLATVMDFIFVYVNFIKISGRFKLRFEKPYLKKFIKESMPIGISALLGMIHFKGDTFILSIFKSQADVGIYSASYRIFENLVFLPGVFLGLVFPKLSYYAKVDKEKLIAFFQKIFNILIFLALPITIFFAMTSPYIVKIIAGQEFYGSIFPTTVLSFALLAIFLAAPFNQLIIANGKQKTLLWTTSITVAVNIVLNLIFIPKFSYKGAAAITLITEFLLMFLMFYFSKTENKFFPKFNILLRMFFPILMITSLLFVFRFFIPFSMFETQGLIIEIIELIALVIITFGVYTLFSLYFKVFPKQFIKETIKGE